MTVYPVVLVIENRAREHANPLHGRDRVPQDVSFQGAPTELSLCSWFVVRAALIEKA